jgi:aminopeptidase-like protein
MIRVLRQDGGDHHVADFSPYGYDERQYCSPGFDLPVGRFSRSEYGTYPQYHTSADDLEFVSRTSLMDSLTKVAQTLTILETNATYRNTSPWCEPQLGRRGLYDKLDARTRLALLWVLNLSDGNHSLLDVAERSKMPFAAILAAATALEDAGLLERAG